jgi:hypothetical protein
MHDEVRQMLGGLVGAVIGVTLKLVFFPDNNSLWWWLAFPVLCGSLGVSIAKK